MKRSDLAALRAKYEEMLRLRLDEDRLRRDNQTGDPRREMAALAARFPGALREIDDLPLDAIRARVAELLAAEDGGPPAPWMVATHLFHTMTRGALCAKKWLAGKKRDAIDADVVDAFEREAPALCWGDDALAWRADLARLASPPRGRVTDLVYERIAAAMDVTVAEVRLLVFGLNRRERRAGAA